MVEILDLKELEDWLSKNPNDWQEAISTRSVLRALPAIRDFLVLSKRQNNLKKGLLIKFLRAIFINQAFNKGTEFKNNIDHAFDALSRSEKDINNSNGFSFYSKKAYEKYARANYNILEKSNFAAIKNSHHAIVAAKSNYTVESALETTRAERGLFAAYSNDCNYLEGGISSADLLGFPLWRGENGNPLGLYWYEIKGWLRELNPNWQFWIDWYQSKLDGTLHPGLTQAQQEGLYYKIATFPNELWEEGAEAVNQRIAELMKEEAESASNDLVETIIAPDELDGSHIELSDGKFELAKSNSPLSKDFDEETQEILRNRIQSHINMLSEQVSRVSNQHPRLHIVIKEYRSQLDNDLDELNSAEFWGHSVSLMAQAKAYLTQNTSGTMSPALEPNLCALLEEVSQLNGGFILGFPRGAELSKKANEAQLPAGFDQPSSELIKLLNDQKEIIGDKLSHLLTSISEAVDAGGWKFARLEYSAVSTLHNLLLSIGKTVIKFDQTILKSGTGVTVYALLIAQKFPEINPTTIQIIWDLLLGHPSLIAQFTAPFPELHKWMEYVIKRAEVLKTDNEINNKEE